MTRHGDEVARAYLDAVVAAAAGSAAPGPGRRDRTELNVVYTPMHGVAGPLMLRALRQAGFAAPHVVAAQAEPDPDFPTVPFPNPEEPGALDLALADARGSAPIWSWPATRTGTGWPWPFPSRERLAGADRGSGGRPARCQPD